MNFISQLIPYLALASHVLLVVLVLALVFRNSWGVSIAGFLGKHVVALGLVVALGAIAGSLFYSEVIGFEACVLCWWQRAFLYPLAPIFAVALWRGYKNSYAYAVPLAAIVAVVAGYQAFSNFSGVSLLSCTSAESACSKIYVMAFGYITIPVMSLTVALYIFLLAWANKTYQQT